MSINERLFDLLVEHRKSQKGLAVALGISERTVSAWKSRGSEPPSSLIPRIAAFFGLSIEWLLTGDAHRQGGIAVSGTVSGNAIVGSNHGSVVVRNGEKRLLSEEAGELLRVYEMLDVRRRMKLLDTAFALEEELNGSRA